MLLIAELYGSQQREYTPPPRGVSRIRSSAPPAKHPPATVPRAAVAGHSIKAPPLAHPLAGSFRLCRTVELLDSPWLNKALPPALQSEVAHTQGAEVVVATALLQKKHKPPPPIRQGAASVLPSESDMAAATIGASSAALSAFRAVKVSPSSSPAVKVAFSRLEPCAEHQVPATYKAPPANVKACSVAQMIARVEVTFCPGSREKFCGVKSSPPTCRGSPTYKYMRRGDNASASRATSSTAAASDLPCLGPPPECFDCATSRTERFGTRSLGYQQDQAPKEEHRQQPPLFSGKASDPSLICNEPQQPETGQQDSVSDASLVCNDPLQQPETRRQDSAATCTSRENQRSSTSLVSSSRLPAKPDEVVAKEVAEQVKRILRVKAKLCPGPDWCRVLELTETFNREELKTKRNQLLKVIHPDKQNVLRVELEKYEVTVAMCKQAYQNFEEACKDAQTYLDTCLSGRRVPPPWQRDSCSQSSQGLAQYSQRLARASSVTSSQGRATSQAKSERRSYKAPPLDHPISYRDPRHPCTKLPKWAVSMSETFVG